MTDREKVRKGLEQCIIPGMAGCIECPYRDKWRTFCAGKRLLEDALELLNAQKPTPVAVDVDAEPYWKATCGGCKEPLSLFAAPIVEVMNFAKYCPHCGRPLNWLPHHNKGDEK